MTHRISSLIIALCAFANVALADYTFTQGTVVYADFSAITQSNFGMNLFHHNGRKYTAEIISGSANWTQSEDGYFNQCNAPLIKVTFTEDAVVGSNFNALIKCENANWQEVFITANPAPNQNLLIVAADGRSLTWSTYNPDQPEQPNPDQPNVFKPSRSISKTLPVIYVNTNGNAPINSTEVYIPATCYIDSMGLPQYRSNGSQQQPLSMQIRGRGNYTWNGFDKKPYKIKLDAGTKLLGLHKSKHWALIAAADDNLGFFRNTVGFFLSKRLNMPYTPVQVPVELVINGQYKGLYFLTETIRIDNHRVDITKPIEGTTHPDSITGGWLVEIDNYSSAGNIEFNEGNGQHLMITLHQPEIVSQQQRDYLTAQMLAINTAIYNYQSEQWLNLIDIDDAVRFYLVQEIMEDCESYHGSCYLYKDMDNRTLPNGVVITATEKWHFGPVWDFGNAYNRRQEQLIYQNPSFEQFWIAHLATQPAFQEHLMKYWYLFLNACYDDVLTWIDEFAEQVQYAAQNDALVWNNTQGYCNNANIAAKKDEFLRLLEWRIRFLQSRWGEGKPGIADNYQPDSKPGDNTAIISPSNPTIQSPSNDTAPTKQLINQSVVIIKDGHYYNPLGQLIK